jgi:hypothetical protein
MIDYEFSLMETEVQVINQARLIDTENLNIISESYDTLIYTQSFKYDSAFRFWAYYYSFSSPSSQYELVDGIKPLMNVNFPL